MWESEQNLKAQLFLMELNEPFGPVSCFSTFQHPSHLFSHTYTDIQQKTKSRIFKWSDRGASSVASAGREPSSAAGHQEACWSGKAWSSGTVPHSPPGCRAWGCSPAPGELCRSWRCGSQWCSSPANGSHSICIRRLKVKAMKLRHIFFSLIVTLVELHICIFIDLCL